MQLHSIRIKGLAPYVNETYVNFDELPGTLTAITGANGSGKSTLLNLYAAACVASNKKFFFMPGRGSRTTLTSLSVSRDSFIEVAFSFAGKDYLVRHSIDGVSGKTDCSVVCDGKAVLKNKSGSTEFLAWSAENLLPPDVFFGSVFSSQRTRGMLGMDPAERKALILKVLGLDRYEALSAGARKNKSEADTALRVAAGRLQEIGENSIAFCSNQVSQREAEKRTADEGLRLGTATVESLRKKNAASDAARVDYDAQAKRLRELDEAVQSLRVRIGIVNTKISASKELIAEEADIKRAVEEIEGLEKEIQAHKKAEHQLALDLSKELGALDKINSELSGIENRRAETGEAAARLEEQISVVESQLQDINLLLLKSAEIQKAVQDSADLGTVREVQNGIIAELSVKVARLEGSLSEVKARQRSNRESKADLAQRQSGLSDIAASKPRVQAAVESVAEIERDLATAEAERLRWVKEVEFLQSKITTSKDTRIAGLFGGHSDIAGGLAEPVARALRAMNDDGHLEAEAEQNPVDLTAARQEVVNCEAALTEFRNALQPLRTLGASFPAVLEAEAALVAVGVEIEALDTLWHSLVEESNGVITEQDAVTADVDNAKANVKRLDDEIAVLAHLVARAGEVATARTRQDGLNEQQQSLTSRKHELADSYATWGITATRLRISADAAAERVEGIKLRAMEAQTVLAGLEAACDARGPSASLMPELQQAQVRVEELLHQRSGFEKEMAEGEHKRDGIELGEAPGAALDLTTYEKALQEAQTAATDAATQLTIASEALRRAEAVEGRRQALAGEVDTLGRDAAEWKRLGDDLQAVRDLVVDASGPRLTVLANDLLRASQDTRFSVRISTSKMDSTGKKELETCEIEILDSRDGSIKTGASGGEESFINKALAGALTELACQHLGLARPTLIDDEGDSSLDAEYASAYLLMLRRLADELDASRVLFVTHRPDLWNMADSRLVISSGEITVA